MRKTLPPSICIPSLVFALLLSHGAEAATLTDPYETTVTATGHSEASATSYANVAEAVVAAWGDGVVGDVTVVGNSTAYAGSESILEVIGGTAEDTVMVDITFSIEVGTWKSANSATAGSIASANGLIDITDCLDENTTIWEHELDLHITGSTTAGEDDVVSVTETISLKSGHSYLVALEAFAEAWAQDQGWARAEAIVDPVFNINPGQRAGYSLTHTTPPGSSADSVPEPSSMLLGMFGMITLLRRKRA